MTIYVPNSTVPPEGRYGAARQVGGIGSGYGHRGVDHHADEGTPIYAVGPCRSVSWGRSRDDVIGSYGFWRLYDFGDHQTLIAHLLDGRGATGPNVPDGAIIGYVGKTGNARFGPPHVHEEARQRGVPIDPAPFYTAFAGSIGVPIPTEKRETMDSIYMKVKGKPDQAILQPIAYAFPNEGELEHCENLYPRQRTVTVGSIAAFDTIMKMHGRPVPRRG